MANDAQVRVVRYQVKPEHADENKRLVENVYKELAERSPDGFRYATFRLEDGVTFVHVAVVEGANPLFDLPAFAEFQSELGTRCSDPPNASSAAVVGSYGLGLN